MCRIVATSIYKFAFKLIKNNKLIFALNKEVVLKINTKLEQIIEDFKSTTQKQYWPKVSKDVKDYFTNC